MIERESDYENLSGTINLSFSLYAIRRNTTTLTGLYTAWNLWFIDIYMKHCFSCSPTLWWKEYEKRKKNKREYINNIQITYRLLNIVYTFFIKNSFQPGKYRCSNTSPCLCYCSTFDTLCSRHTNVPRPIARLLSTLLVFQQKKEFRIRRLSYHYNSLF